jgi:hypothetical protein
VTKRVAKGNLTELQRLIHNVRGPLNSISMNAELGKMYIQEGKTPESVLRALDTIVAQCAMCGSALESLHTYLADRERA